MNMFVYLYGCLIIGILIKIFVISLICFTIIKVAKYLTKR
nr:hypothetical protein QKQZYOMX_QKQZYOMX_CDS_0008 [Microvirus sp.]